MIFISSRTEDIEADDIDLDQDQPAANAVDFSALEPDYYGPTWARGEDGKLLLPEHTLGWEVIGWCSKYLQDPNKPGTPWRFTNEQARFVLWWYAIDKDGKWIYRRGVLQRMKGWLLGQGPATCRHLPRRASRPVPLLALG